uniref:PHD-type domain-containing protein n=1 Tax=Anopheles atroparvus TaxID=41427 RepID=A0A182J3B2_ANOAO
MECGTCSGATDGSAILCIGYCDSVHHPKCLAIPASCLKEMRRNQEVVFMCEGCRTFRSGARFGLVAEMNIAVERMRTRFLSDFNSLLDEMRRKLLTELGGLAATTTCMTDGTSRSPPAVPIHTNDPQPVCAPVSCDPVSCAPVFATLPALPDELVAPLNAGAATTRTRDRAQRSKPAVCVPSSGAASAVAPNTRTPPAPLPSRSYASAVNTHLLSSIPPSATASSCPATNTRPLSPPLPSTSSDQASKTISHATSVTEGTRAPPLLHGTGISDVSDPPVVTLRPSSFTWLFFPRLAPSVGEDDITAMVCGRLTLDRSEFVVRKLVKRDTDAKSLACVAFKVGVPASCRDRALRTDTWPSSISFREFDHTHHNVSALTAAVPLSTDRTPDPVGLPSSRRSPTESNAAPKTRPRTTVLSNASTRVTRGSPAVPAE